MGTPIQVASPVTLPSNRAQPAAPANLRAQSEAPANCKDYCEQLYAKTPDCRHLNVSRVPHVQLSSTSPLTWKQRQKLILPYISTSVTILSATELRNLEINLDSSLSVTDMVFVNFWLPIYEWIYTHLVRCDLRFLEFLHFCLHHHSQCRSWVFYCHLPAAQHQSLPLSTPLPLSRQAFFPRSKSDHDIYMATTL